METITLLIKKIAVGVVVFAIPLAIYYAGLWLVRHVLQT